MSLKKLAEYVKEKYGSHEALAHEIGVDRTTVWRILEGKTVNPSPAVVEKFRRAGIDLRPAPVVEEGPGPASTPPPDGPKADDAHTDGANPDPVS